MKNLRQQIEGLIFIAGDEGITIEQLRDVLETSSSEIEKQLRELISFHESSESSLLLVDYGKKFRFVTKPVCFEAISKFLNISKVKQLSQSALETLAIIAYKQPITRVEIEEIRGVGSEIILRKLQSLDLIIESGRLETPGRPILYGVSEDFLDVFKMVSLNELPELNMNNNEEQELFQ